MAQSTNEHDILAYCGATGTLLIGGIIFPIYCLKKPGEETRKHIIDLLETCIKGVMAFLALLIIFSRFDVIFTLKTKIYELGHFTGVSVSFHQKLLQYINFIANCFVLPDACIDTIKYSHVSWQLSSVLNTNNIGIIFFALAAIGLILNRKDYIARISVFWIIYSFMILFVLGWGTAENGLILYSLYFYWAFFVLIFKLADAVGRKAGMKYLPHIVCILGSIAMLCLNIPGMSDLINFAITYYPA